MSDPIEKGNVRKSVAGPSPEAKPAIVSSSRQSIPSAQVALRQSQLAQPTDVQRAETGLTPEKMIKLGIYYQSVAEREADKTGSGDRASQ